jgi:hypothetical protein
LVAEVLVDPEEAVAWAPAEVPLAQPPEPIALGLEL